MNLMKLFNINYLKQNFKKSKVILSIFIGLIPILNTIILIMNFNNNNGKVFSFAEISIINFIGIYVLPVIVSICLFNYIYKKRSVDFINSMPISRKSVFVTNTIFGILIFLSMLIVNMVLMSILTLVFNIPIPFAMMFDYLWYWFVVYVFSFSATNLAMSISGNAITQIVVTLLLVFLVPFTHAFTTELSNVNTENKTYLKCDSSECIVENYYCYDDLECNINKNENIYEFDIYEKNNNNYTSLFGNIYTIFTNEDFIFNFICIIKMIILSIIYIILGCILFIRRKMEVSETSFKNKHIHNIVKSLTLVPIVGFAYLMCKYESIVSIIFVLVIILIYYFVYDLITKKNINNIKLSIIYFIIVVSGLTIFYSILEISSDKTDKNIIKYSDIKEVAVETWYSIRKIESSNSTIDMVYIKNDELKKILINSIINNSENIEKKVENIIIYLKTKNNKEFIRSIQLTKEDYNKVMNILSQNKKYINHYKNINFDNVYAVKIGDNLYNKKDSETILKLVKDSLNNLSLKEINDLHKKYSNVSDDFHIRLYTYENHDSEEYIINGYINYNLLNSIVNSNNKVLKENMEIIIPEEYFIYYQDKYTEEEFTIDYYVLRNAKNEIYNFVLKELENTVDMKKEFITLEIRLNNNNYLFTTNNIKEFKEILNKKREEIKDKEEYKDYYSDYYDDEKYSYELEDYLYVD